MLTKINILILGAIVAECSGHLSGPASIVLVGFLAYEAFSSFQAAVVTQLIAQRDMAEKLLGEGVQNLDRKLTVLLEATAATNTLLISALVPQASTESNHIDPKVKSQADKNRAALKSV